jgi:hypothetical protein
VVLDVASVRVKPAEIFRLILQSLWRRVHDSRRNATIWPRSGPTEHAHVADACPHSEDIRNGNVTRRPSESSQDGLLTRHAVSAEAGFWKAPD